MSLASPSPRALWLRLLLVLAVCFGAPAAAEAGPLGYVGNYNSDSLSVIDTGTDTVVDTITGVIDPYGIALTPDNTRAYVTNLGPRTVTVVDLTTRTVMGIV